MNLENLNNESFSRSIATQKMAVLLSELTRLTSRADFSLSQADLEELGNAREESLKLVNTYFDHMLEKAAERRANLVRYAGIHFISLGEDCFSRTIPTQWGLKPSSKLGEKTCPFDLSVHLVAMLPSIIRSDFAGYLDPENFSYLEDRGFCRNNVLSIQFNHEKGVKYAENDFQVLRDAYRRRIGNFRELLADAGRIVFLIHFVRPRSETCVHIKNTLMALREKCSSKDIMMICINTWEPDQVVDAGGRDLLDGENVSFVDVHYPFPKYVWFRPDCCFSPEGHQFEKEVITRIKEIVDDWAATGEWTHGGH
jgi:hypothetical protein